MAYERKFIYQFPKHASQIFPQQSYVLLLFGLAQPQTAIGIDRLTKISDRHFSGAFRNLANKWEFSLDPRPELYFDLVPIDLLSGGFTSLVLIQSPVQGKAGDARGAIEIRFLFRCRIEPDFVSLDHL